MTCMKCAGWRLSSPQCVGVSVHSAGLQAGAPATEDTQPGRSLVTDHCKWREVMRSTARIVCEGGWYGGLGQLNMPGE